MEEAAAVLDLDSWALHGQKGGESISKVGSGSTGAVEAATAERSLAASSSSSSHLLTAPKRRGWGQNVQRQGPALKKLPF